MTMGRPPKPTHLKVLEGNPGKRALNKHEPKPHGKVPSCPKHLDRVARAEWRRMSKLLLGLGLLTEVDRAALAAYCQCWARVVRCEEELAKLNDEWVFTTDKGYQAQTPWLSIANKAYAEMRAYITEFGLSPAARTRIQVKPPEKEDEYESYLKRARASR